MTFDPPFTAVREAVARALAEDLGPLGDVTSAAVVAPGATGAGALVARRAGVLAGRAAATEVFAQVDGAVDVAWAAADGDPLAAGQAFARLRGPLASILMAERSALNFLGHLGGVATLTRAFVDAGAASGGARIRDTRKTTPGLRALEKAAVRAGGGANHRGGLSDAVLIKDNHLHHLGVAEAVAAARARWPGMVVEVECDTLAQVAQAKAARPDLVLVDNMTPDEVAEAVGILGGAVAVEVSGGVTLANVARYAAAGASLIAVGEITHSAPALDVALDLDGP